jgi:hypothetical protein
LSLNPEQAVTRKYFLWLFEAGTYGSPFVLFQQTAALAKISHALENHILLGILGSHIDKLFQRLSRSYTWC